MNLAPTATKREIARAVVDQFADHSCVGITEVVGAGCKVGVSRRTARRACTEPGVRAVHNWRYPAFREKS